MNILNLPLDELINKYGSRKSLSAIFGMVAIAATPIPEMLEPTIAAYLSGAKIAGITILGVVAVLAQWNLDKQKNGEPEKP